ncbi:hypothetical protein AAG906_002186 [Vitis piasezkii]
MPDIERYIGIGFPRIHLQLYSAVMRGHRLDEAQMIMLFPMSLSGAALYGIEKGISRGLWADSSPSDSKGKKPRQIFMMGWDGKAPQPISLYTNLDFSGYIHSQKTPRPFKLIPDEIPGQTSFPPVYLQHVPPLTPFILFPEGYGPIHRDVQIVTKSGRIAQPPPVDRPFAGTDSREEVQREDDEILRQLHTTQASISIWSLLASSSTHRDALIRAISQIRVDTATTPEGLIHFLKADRATCIVFSDDDLPPEGSDHVRPLFIDVACLGRRVSYVLLDNGSTLNVCPLVTTIALGFSPSDFGSSTQTVRAYDGTQRTVMGFSHHLTCFWAALGFMRRVLYHLSFIRSSDITEASDAMIVAPPLPDRASMDMIGTGHILDAAPHELHSAFDMFGGASDSVDPPLSFDIMSGFVTRFDDVSDGNNDMSIFEYLPVSQHFPLIAPPVPTTHICDVDDLIDFGASDQPREIRIGSSLSPDERSRLIDLLRSYLDVFAWSYEDMSGLDPSIVQHRLPILPHVRPVNLQVKEEIQKQLGVGFLSVVEYPEWLANVVPIPKKDGKVRVCVDFRDLNKASPKDDFPLPHIDMLVDSTWGTYCYRVMPFGLKNAGATYQRAATALFHDMMHRDVEVYVDDMIVKSRDRADHLAALTDICEPIFRLLRKNQPTIWDDDCQRAFEKVKEYLLSPPVLVPPTLGRPLLLYLSVSDMALGCMLAQLDDSGKERAIYYLSKRMLEYECRYIMIERLCLALVWATRRLRHYACSDWQAHEMVGAIIWLLCQYSMTIDRRFPDEQFVSMTSIAGWRLYFDGAANQSGFGIGILLISPQGLETALDLGVRQLEIHGDSNLSRESVLDALATLASMIEILAG